MNNRQLTTLILRWYKKEGRDLPWRHTRDPYKILVSEMMLQQTQVDRVIEKYHSFLKRFPTVEKLARAKTSSVIKEWAGLGYNRRALYLQRCAQSIVNEYQGIFPSELNQLKTLPGIGDYTARALLSFAFEQRVPMMDTNHRKFYSRLFHIDAPDDILLKKAEAFMKGLSGKKVHDLNQAIMDLTSAIVRKERTGFVAHFDRMYPDVQIQKKTKRKAIKFEDTDRYIRGRIVDALRREKKKSLASLQKMFLHIENERFNRIITKLEKDKLIVRDKKSILLP